MPLRAAFAFTPAESKRLIGRAVAAMEEVRTALADDLIVIAHGSTNVYVAEEILGGALPRPRGTFLSGQIFNGVMCQTEPSEKGPMLVLDRGKRIPPKPTMGEVLEAGGPHAVVIKGANAVDPDGHAGVFCAHPGCGTIGFAYGFISGRGVKLIVPVGLEKLVPSVPRASRALGHDNLYYQTGFQIGMMPLVNAKVVTEITALHILFGLEAVHVGGGGVSGSEGTVVVVATGEKAALDRAIAAVEAIKGEPPLATMKAACATCVPTTPALLAGVEEQTPKAPKLSCIFQGKAEAALPPGFVRRPGVP
ncbi:MAG TPA: hypothetical protein VFQ27_13595 [Xanthobacteraceae bacterium]|nr:hypothetical protein [Xanthobacteraceae bacterium]